MATHNLPTIFSVNVIPVIQGPLSTCNQQKPFEVGNGYSTVEIHDGYM
jgi:hypothetical protein